MAGLSTLTVPAPYNGLNTVAPPGKCPTGTGPLVRNFLVHTPGKLTLRGPITKEPYAPAHTSLTMGYSNAILTGVMQFHDKLYVGFVEPGGTGYVPPWVAPYWKPTEALQLDTAKANQAYVNLTTGGVTSIVSEAKYAPVGQSSRIENYTYAFAYQDATTEELSKGFLARTKLLRWNGAAEKPTILTNAPEGGQSVKAHLNRLFILGGRDPNKQTEFQKVPFKVEITTAAPSHTYISCSDSVSGGLGQLEKYFPIGAEVKHAKLPEGTKVLSYGSASSGTHFIWCEKLATENVVGAEVETKSAAPIIEQNALFWSVQGGPTQDEAKFWQDEVTGLVNRIIVGDSDNNDFGVALAVCNGALVIFKRHSIWALYGYSNTTFQIKNLTQERGCIDPNSVCEVDGGVYFMSQQGFEFYDGSQFQTVDDAIANITRPLSQFLAGERGVQARETNYGRITATYMGNNYLMLTLASQLTANGTGAPRENGNFTFLYHIPSGNWTEFEPHGVGSTGTALYIDTANSIPWMFSGNWISPLPFVTNPEAAELRGFPQLDVNAETGAKESLQAIFWTDRIEMAAPGYKSQMHRYMLDYKWPNKALDSEALAGWAVTLYDDTNAIKLFTEEQVPGQAYSGYTSPLQGPGNSEYLYGRRWVKDVFNEANTIRLEVLVKASTTAEVRQGEVYDSTLEFEITRQKRAT